MEDGDPFNFAVTVREGEDGRERAALDSTDGLKSHCYSIFKAKFEGIMAAAPPLLARPVCASIHTFHRGNTPLLIHKGSIYVNRLTLSATKKFISSSQNYIFSPAQDHWELGFLVRA